MAGILRVGEQDGQWVTSAGFTGPDAVKTPDPCQQHNCGTAVLVFFTRVLSSGIILPALVIDGCF